MNEIESFSGQALLKAYASLTHRMHAANRKRDKFLENDLRIQRNLLEDEILRRMGDQIEELVTDHFIAVNADYDDMGVRRSWDVERCSCDSPWRHGNNFIGVAS